ncbi:hypothetical protein [uncultured Corynebacterium sp.]|uniref:hypothetical protein n=1 Tax=uncultured Corynebacterium sp. TaxID=159447 RepID=UPI0025FCCC0D|nr:hypothetical protein [uncultured Corynebacterium sp.]
MFAIPFPIVIENITTTGSVAIDFLSGLSIRLYDAVQALGSSTSGSLSVEFGSLISSL